MKAIKIEYILIDKAIPTIKGKQIYHDVRVGGEKLVYKTVSYPVNIYKLFDKFTITIPLLFYRKKSNGIGIDKTESKVVYLRPYKKNWAPKRRPDGSKEKKPFHLWGKKDHPLTNIWIELEYDYEDIIKSIPIIKETVIDDVLIKFLRQHKDKFYLIKKM